jgi:hypothetical protein
MFPYQFSLGICNCRSVRGGSTFSHHANCRAYDCGIPTNDKRYRPELGDPIHRLLGPHGQRLGFDHLILNRIIYSRRSPDGRPYKGVHPHYNHAHIGLTSKAGANLNYATLVAVLGEPAGGPTPGGDLEMNALKLGSKGDAVGYYQEALNNLVSTKPLLKVDKDFGTKTDTAVRQYQADADVPENGIIDGVLGHLIGRKHGA